MNWPIMTQLLLLTLATGHAVDLWLNAEIFATLRSKLQPRWYLFNCGYCLTVHATGVLLLLAMLIPLDIGWYVVLWLAACRTSWLLNNFLPDHLQYQLPNVEDRFEDVDEAADESTH